MSTKTYAGFLSGASNGKFMSGDKLVTLVPMEGGDDDPYTTRFGRNPNGSGPWMCVRRVTDVNVPSTDGTYNVWMRWNGTNRRNPFEARYTEGTRTAWFGVLWSRTYGYAVEYNEQVYYDGEYNPRSTYKYVGYYHQVYTYSAYYNDGSLPFTLNSTLAMFERGDFDAALQLVKWAGSVGVTLPGYTPQYPQYTDGVTRLKSCEFYKAIDLDPPEAVYLEYRDKASLYLETGILPGDWAMSLETAYVEASKQLPQAATNAAANILEAAHLLASIFTGNILGEVPKTAKDAWLAYRYVYTTTKLDVEEVRSTFSRLDNLASAMRVPTYGSYVRDGVTFRVGYEVDTAQIIPTDVSTTMRKFGLELNFLNAWDMIPYSFIVDWFLPVSEVIEYFQDLGACRLDPLDLWWSLTTVKDGFMIYVRLPGRKLSTMPYLQLRRASQKTIALRIADTVALFAP